MSLSDETLKNLFDVMQKVSLAITVVSLALLANFLFSQKSLFVRAEDDLKRLENLIRDVQNDTPERLLKWPYQRMSVYAISPIKIKTEFSLVSVATALVKTQDVFYEMPGSPWIARSFGSAENLEELRNIWDAANLCRKYTLRRSFFAGLDANGFKKDFACRVEGPPIDISRPFDFYFPPTLNIDPSKSIQFDQGYAPQGWTAEIDFDLSPTLYSARSINALSRMLDAGKGNYAGGLPRPTKAAWIYPDLTQNVKLRTDWQTVASRPWIFGKLGLSDMESGSFAKMFPNLNQLTDPFEKQRLSSLKASLDVAAEQSREQIEVFGAKFSNSLIPLFGFPLLLVLEIQFWAVAIFVRSNIRHLKMDLASLWSYFLPGRAFLLLGFGTIVALPVGAGAITIYSQFSVNYWLMTVYLLLLLSLLFASGLGFIEFADIRSSVSSKTPIFSEERERWTDLVRRKLGSLVSFGRNKAR